MSRPVSLSVGYGVDLRMPGQTSEAPRGVIECDVAILGSGMGGATFAHGLRESGLDIVVVERGDFLPRERENWDPDAVFAKGRYRNAESWVDGNREQAFRPGVFYYVGGNTKFYGAMLPRFRVEDFGEVQHAEGVSPAWPVAYADFERWYSDAEKLYRVHGTEGADPTDPWRSGPYPYPAIPHDPALIPLEQSLRRSGLKPFSMPAAVDYGVGLPCILCSTCDGYPCQVDAKRDAEISCLRPALAAGRIRLFTRTKVERLETTEDATAVAAAKCSCNGESTYLVARRFVVACGAVNSAALLLRSRNKQHPRGLGNSSGLLGRNYMVHNSTFMLAVDPRRKNTVSFQKTLAVNDWYKASGDTPYPLGNVQMLGKIREQMISPMYPWIPSAPLRYLTNHSVDLYLTSEDLPSRENRVEFDDVKARVKVFWTPTNLLAHEGLVRKITKELRRAGYPLILRKRMGIATNSHQCGTAVMGCDAGTSVLNTDCRMHDLQNVWVVDSSFFPSSGAVNPALTIAANALRVASRWSDANVRA